MVLAYSTVRASQNHMICSIIRKYLAGRHCRCIFVPKSLAEIHYRHGTLYRYRVGSGRNNKNRRNQSKKYMTSSDSPDQFTPAWTPTFPALFPFTRDRRSEFPSKWSPRVVPRLWSCCFLQPLTIRPLEPRWTQMVNKTEMNLDDEMVNDENRGEPRWWNDEMMKTEVNLDDEMMKWWKPRWT